MKTQYHSSKLLNLERKALLYFTSRKGGKAIPDAEFLSSPYGSVQR
jgi:hypothetical protein